MTDELLPCPFCGGTRVDVVENGTSRWRVSVRCGCGAFAPEIRFQAMGEGTPAELKNAARKRAIEVWNTRAPAEPKD